MFDPARPDPTRPVDICNMDAVGLGRCVFATALCSQTVIICAVGCCGGRLQVT